MAKLPTILYNSAKEKYQNYNRVTSNCTYFYSYQDFYVKIKQVEYKRKDNEGNEYLLVENSDFSNIPETIFSVINDSGTDIGKINLLIPNLSLNNLIIGPNNITYFTSNINGIWYLDIDNKIKPTNQNNIGFSNGIIGPNNILYFLSLDNGIYYLDPIDEQIKQTNKTNGYFMSGIIGPNNILYFLSHNSGIWYLDIDNNEIKPTNKNNGFFQNGIIGTNNILYFIDNTGNSGIWYLDIDNNEIKPTNITNTIKFANGVNGSNNITYFTAHENGGIYYLDPIDKQIKQTNKTTGYIIHGIVGPNNITYFCDYYYGGISYLDNSDGQIKPTHWNYWSYNKGIIGPNNELYFLGTNNYGILKLDKSSGNFYLTNQTKGSFINGGFASNKIFYLFESTDIYNIQYESGILKIADKKNFDGIKIIEGSSDNNIKLLYQNNIGFNSGIIGPNNVLYFTTPNGDGIWFLDTLDGQIKPTNKDTYFFNSGIIGPNDVLYFYSIQSFQGIWFLDTSDGQIKQTNVITGSFTSGIIGPNNILYFYSFGDSMGIWFLDTSDGQIKQTNRDQGMFKFSIIGPNNILYFLSNYSNTGIWFLDTSDGQIKPTNKTNGYFNSGIIGPNNVLYFLTDLNNSGILYLDISDGQIKQTNRIVDTYVTSIIGPNNVLYFCSGTGVWFLDTDGQIKQISFGVRFDSLIIGPNNILYFLSKENNGIYFLDTDGQIKPTNKTDGSFISGIIRSNNVLYFLSSNNMGIWFLDTDGQIKPTNKIDQNFIFSINGPANKLYFLSRNSIWYLDAQKITIKPDNFGYTLYIKDPNTKVTLETKNETGLIEEIVFEYINSNEISEDKGNIHYLDNIINKYLPSYDELSPAIFKGTTGIDNFTDNELIKRLLLDFREIMKFKGTKKSIELFFNLVGINNIEVFAEWLKLNRNSKIDLSETSKNQNQYYIDKQNSKKYILSTDNNNNNNNDIYDNRLITLSPDTETDIKTGNYHVIYFNWIKTDRLDKNNLPVREFLIEDITEFFEKLKYAIALANQYFTLVEQEITFFGITFNANIPVNQTVTLQFNDIFKHDIFHFRKGLDIDIYNQHVHGENYHRNLVVNKRQVTHELYRDEIKAQILNTPTDILFWIYREILDNESFDGSKPEEFYDIFGNCLTFDLLAEEHLIVEIKIIDTISGYTLKSVVNLIPNIKSVIQAVTKQPSIYRIEINAIDDWNNREYYKYTYTILDDVRYVDFEIFTSKHMITENGKVYNQMNQDIDSPSEMTQGTDILYTNYILPLSTIATLSSLTEYYNQTLAGLNLRWLSNQEKQIEIPDISQYSIVNEVTDTVPIELVDQWMEMFNISLIDGDRFKPANIVNELKVLTIKIRLFDADKAEYFFFNINEIPSKFDSINKLFCSCIVIDEQTQNGTDIYYPVIIIGTVETGLQLERKLFDIYLFRGLENLGSIYDMLDYSEKNPEDTKYKTIKLRLPVNYDYPLFHPVKTIDINPVQVLDTTSYDYMAKICIDNFQSFHIAKTDFQIEIESIKYNVMKSMFPRLINIESDVNQQNYENHRLSEGDVFVARINRDLIIGELDIVWTLIDTLSNIIVTHTDGLTLKARLVDNTVYTIVCEFTVNGNKFTKIRESVLTSFKKSKILE
jgi:hypothetical protein